MLLVLITALLPVRAYAVPIPWRGTPVVMQRNVTYRVKDKLAVVTKTTGKYVKIPASITYRGHCYKVRNIWSSALRDAKVVCIAARLEGCDCYRLWSPRLTIKTPSKSVAKQLREMGIKVEEV